MSTRLNVGTDAINIDMSIVAQVISNAISEPARISILNTGDIEIFCAKDPAPIDIREAWAYGTKPLDAILWGGCIPGVIKCKVAPQCENPEKRIAECKRILLHFYLFTLLRGSHPLKSAKAESKLPAFIVKTLDCNMNEAELADAVASFSLSQLEPGWVKNISMENFSSSIKTRISLGLPGYRQINALRICNPKSTATVEEKKAMNWAKKNLCTGFYWDVVANTRSDSISSMFPTLSKSVLDMIATIVSPKDIEQLVLRKVLFAAPSADIQYRTWLNWPKLGTLKLKEPVFTRSNSAEISDEEEPDRPSD